MPATTTLTIKLNNGVEMPALGLGVFQSPPEETTTAVEAAIADGYHLVDTAAAYGNEREVGEAIRRQGLTAARYSLRQSSGSATTAPRAQRGIDGCLRRLGFDYVDLFLLHQPVPAAFDDTIAAYKELEKALSDGRTRAIGVSNFSERHLENLVSKTDVVPSVNQVELHPFDTQQSLRDFHARRGITTEAWSPLGGVNVYRPADPNAVKNPLEHPTVTGLAARYGKTPAQVVLRWHIEQGVVAIPKSVKPHRIKENFGVFDFALTADEVASIDALETGVRGGPDPETISPQSMPYKVDN
jgi:diketogulonate reductase-like aldo/keto reductase